MQNRRGKGRRRVKKGIVNSRSGQERKLIDDADGKVNSVQQEKRREEKRQIDQKRRETNWSEDGE